METLMKLEYSQFLDYDFYLEKIQNREFLENNYYTLVIVLAIFFTIILNIIVRNSIQSITNAIYKTINKTVIISLLLVFIFSNRKNIMSFHLISQLTDQKFLQIWNIFQLLVGFYILIQILNIQSKNIEIQSKMQNRFQEAIIIIQILAVFIGLYVQKQSMMNQYYNQDQQLNSLNDLVNYLQLIAITSFLSISLLGIYKKYEHKLVYMQSNMSLDSNRDSLNINIIQNELAMLDEKLKYYNEKYLMTGNEMNHKQKLKYNYLQNQKQKNLYRLELVQKFDNKKIRITKQFIQIYEIFKMLIQINIFILFYMFVLFQVFHKLQWINDSYDPIRVVQIQYQNTSQWLSQIIKASVVFVFYCIQKNTGQFVIDKKNYPIQMLDEFVEYARCYGNFLFLLFLFPQNLSGDYKDCISSNWLSLESFDCQNFNNFGKVMIPFIDQQFELKVLIFTLIVVFQLSLLITILKKTK